MKKTAFVFATFLVFISSNIYAAGQASTRQMAIHQLYQYGQAIFERGDFHQSAIVFSRLLAMDPKHSGARSYAAKLNKKGENVDIPQFSVEETKPVENVSSKTSSQNASIELPVMTDNPVQPAKTSEDNTLRNPDNIDLKEEIQQADQAINALKAQVLDLRNQLSQKQQIPVI